MKKLGPLFFPQNCPKQVLRIRRVMLSIGSHSVAFLLAIACWQLKYLELQRVLEFMAMNVATVIVFYVLIRSNLNLRFADPSLTMLQLVVNFFPAFYLMYFSGEARGAFLMLTLSGFLYGLFRFRVRQFIIFTAWALIGYGLLIGLLRIYRPSTINLQLEMLRWIALTAVLILFCVLGGYIARLRDEVAQKNIEVRKRNLELEEALQRNRELAIRDELTGIYNRRYLMEMIAIEKQRCDRAGRTFSICIVDVDFFKRVNDTYGHLAGDEVLRAIASTIAEGMRQSDYFGRYGGEEFAMVLTDTVAAGALISVERVRRQIEALTFLKIDPDLKVTISIGISQFLPEEDTSATFKRADQALYRAKEGGRNRSVVAVADAQVDAQVDALTPIIR